MEKLTIKELAPYLPYGVKIRNILGKGSIWTLTRFNIEQFSDDDKLILRPLSQLTEKIDNNPNNLTYSSFLKLWTKEDIDYCKGYPIGVCYETIQQLLEWHFDVFGLIDRGLALPIDGKEVES